MHSLRTLDTPGLWHEKQKQTEKGTEQRTLQRECARLVIHITYLPVSRQRVPVQQAKRHHLHPRRRVPDRPQP